MKSVKEFPVFRKKATRLLGSRLLNVMMCLKKKNDGKLGGSEENGHDVPWRIKNKKAARSAAGKRGGGGMKGAACLKDLR